jgi:hypothetical protein
MAVRTREGIVWKITCVGVLLMGLYLGGCGNGNLGGSQAQAQAQAERGVRTYEIEANTFELQSNSEPTIEVSGEATTYKLVDDGRVVFTSTYGDRNFVLDPDDMVIERPIARSVTVVTLRSRLF